MLFYLADNFDRVEFRNFIDNLEKIPNFEEVARTCINFKEENKIVIYNYLEAIANADGDLAKDEKKLLDDLKNIWSI